MEVGNFVQNSIVNGILSDRISHWSNFLRNYVLDKAVISHVETLAFYQEIINGLFNPDQNYLLLSPDYYYSDCAELVNFLAPDGLMFSFIDLLLNDRSASFEFFLNTAHQDTRDKIFGSKSLQFTREKLDFSQNSLRCNAFDYYFYRFFDYIYSAVECCTTNFDFSEAKFDRVPYFVLFTEYLAHFLPTDKFLSPLLSKNDKKSQISTSALKIGRNYSVDRRCTPLGLIRREYLTTVDSSYPTFGVTENDSTIQADDYFSKIRDFLYILSDLWLYRSRLNPRSECFVTILLTSLLRHVYRFIFYNQSLINEQFSAQLLLFKEDLMRKILAPNFFVYFGLSFNYWPLDSSFDHLCRLWLTFLQPWQINQQNFDQNFVRTYETFYAKFFPIIVRRFLRTEFFNSPKMAQCLSSVLRLFDRNLLNYVKFNDKDFQSLLIKLAENLSFVNDNCEKKLREIECRKKRESVAQKFDWFWQNVGQEADREQFVENLTVIQDNCRQSLEFLKRNFDIDISLSPNRKILSHARTSSGVADKSPARLIEQINGKLKLTPEGREKILNKSLNFDSDANLSLDSAMFDDSSLIKQEFNHSPADLSAVHSDEIEFLANFWTFVSSLINRRYGEQFKEVYQSPGITGFVSRCLLYGPLDDSIMDRARRRGRFRDKNTINGHSVQIAVVGVAHCVDFLANLHKP
uniref:Uncharacterized protein n=1 Tax=Romanomermis culicivorax TaxID=13658 RepID=A0A915JZ40_ROMCU